MQNLVQAVPTSLFLGVNVLGTRRRIVEPHGQSTSQQTAPASLIRAVPTLVDSPEDLQIDQTLSDDLSAPQVTFCLL